MILEILIGLILGGVIGFYFKPKHSNTQLENDTATLKYEVNSMNQKIGGLETELHLKQSELDQLKSNSIVLAAQLGEEIDRNKTVLSQKKSSEVRVGQIVESIAAFSIPGHDPKKIRFIGAPIDLISFQENGIYFIEIKSGQSKLSNGQKRVRQLIKDGKVFWKEVRFAGNNK